MSAVYPSVRSSFDWLAFFRPVIAFNILLICLCAGGFAYYIAGANAVASGQYHISTLRSHVGRLTEEQSVLTAEKSATENLITAATFAQDQHMVEAKDIIYIFENGNVALQR